MESKSIPRLKSDRRMLSASDQFSSTVYPRTFVMQRAARTLAANEPPYNLIYLQEAIGHRSDGGECVSAGEHRDKDDVSDDQNPTQRSFTDRADADSEPRHGVR